MIWEDTRTARVRDVDAVATLPLAWLRVEWTASHEVVSIDLFGHAPAIGDRPWIARFSSFGAALARCDELQRPAAGDEEWDWERGSVEVSDRASSTPTSD